MKKSSILLTPLSIFYISIMGCLLALVVTEPALAAGGLGKVNSFMDDIVGVLHGISIAVVTIAVMWAGYKYLFKHSDITECAKILGGGLLIGGAGEIAAFLV
jgi:type IV secretion system protein VirB2/type IV secretion system protein PtlA